MITKIAQLKEVLKNKRRKTVVLAAAHDSSSLTAIFKSIAENYIDAILIGDEQKIIEIAKKNNYSLKDVKILNITETKKAVEKSIKLIREGEADILMKGKVNTADLIKGVLDKEKGLRNGALLSHFALFELENYHKLIALSDVAINVSPDLNDKINILKNAVNFMHTHGIEKPKVAVLSAVENVINSVPSTHEAAIISKMGERNQIGNCIVDGPLSFDIATSKDAAEYKGCESAVAGDADLLLFPNIESGNMVYKCLVRFNKLKMACMVLGAKCPIILTSRADSEETKLNSILLAAATE
jgi:phosphate butyryltransferase